MSKFSSPFVTLPVFRKNNKPDYCKISKFLEEVLHNVQSKHLKGIIVPINKITTDGVIMENIVRFTSAQVKGKLPIIAEISFNNHYRSILRLIWSLYGAGADSFLLKCSKGEIPFNQIRFISKNISVPLMLQIYSRNLKNYTMVKVIY